MFRLSDKIQAFFERRLEWAQYLRMNVLITANGRDSTLIFAINTTIRRVPRRALSPFWKSWLRRISQPPGNPRHLLAGYDLATIQKLLGHGNVKTTMIYLQTVPSLKIREAKSPLDLD